MNGPNSATTGLGLWLQNELREGAVMIDVSANVGDYTALAARAVGLVGHVYAFEPAPENVARLHERFDALPQVSVRLSAKGPLKPERFVDEFLSRPLQRWSSINIVAVRRGASSTP